MQPQTALLVDVNHCCQIDMSYSTDYVWQMRSQESERATDIHFDTVRLPRPMRVEYPRTAEELVAHWQEKGCFLVIKGKDGIVGFIDGLPQPWLNTLWISNLVVAPKFRQQGIGSQLLQAAHEWAIHRQLGQLSLEIQTKNIRPSPLPKNTAFTSVGIMSDII